jgi:hypothetical protein
MRPLFRDRLLLLARGSMASRMRCAYGTRPHHIDSLPGRVRLEALIELALLFFCSLLPIELPTLYMATFRQIAPGLGPFISSAFCALIINFVACAPPVYPFRLRCASVFFWLSDRKLLLCGIWLPPRPMTDSTPARATGLRRALMVRSHTHARREGN